MNINIKMKNTGKGIVLKMKLLKNQVLTLYIAVLFANLKASNVCAATIGRITIELKGSEPTAKLSSR